MVLVRFPPVTADAVARSAERQHRAYGRFQQSIYGAVKGAGESVDEVVARLVPLAQLDGMSNVKNVLVCTTAGELLDRGFLFYKDGDDDERSEHYCVALDNEWAIEDAERFLSAWTGRRWPA